MVVGLLFFLMFFKHSMLVSRVCLYLYILITLRHGGNPMQIILINKWQNWVCQFNPLNKEQEFTRAYSLYLSLTPTSTLSYWENSCEAYRWLHVQKPRMQNPTEWTSAQTPDTSMPASQPCGSARRCQSTGKEMPGFSQLAAYPTHFLGQCGGI